MFQLSAGHYSAPSQRVTPFAAPGIWLRAVVFLMFALTCSAVLAQSPQKHPFGIDDYSALHSAHVIAVSPDGNSILYHVTTDGTQGPTKHEIRMIDTSGDNSRKLDLPDKFRPLGFTKDGALFGEYPVDNASQLAIIPLAAEKPTLIIALPNGVQAAFISPDGARSSPIPSPKIRSPAYTPFGRMRKIVCTSSTFTVAAAPGGAPA